MPLLKYRTKVISEAWTDKEIEPGQRPDDEIRKELGRMDIFVCLISPHFALSDYISGVELRIARERYERQEIEVVPILVTKPGGTECAWLESFEYLPLKGKSWVQIRRENSDYDLALHPIRDGIAKVIERVRKNRLHKPVRPRDS